MMIFAIKLLKNIRTAIAGRKYPSQLAWAVAFGVLLGIIPHGNLLALLTLIVVLSLRVNHAMAGLTAVGTTFLATKFDPFSDQLGQQVLSHPKLGALMADAWQLPLVPWTDLNNTVVMGSFLIGVGSILPIFLFTYPLFRLFAPSAQTPDDSPVEAVAQSEPPAFRDRAHDHANSPHLVDHPVPRHATADVTQPTTEPIGEDSVDRILTSLDDEQVQGPLLAGEPIVEAGIADSGEAGSTGPNDSETKNQVAVETRIDVIRMKDYRDVNATDDAGDLPPNGKPTGDGNVTPEQPLDEALNYLLRQLRDSQQRKAG